MPVAKADASVEVRPSDGSKASLAQRLRTSTDHYRTLGVPPDASREQIKAAYRRRAMRLHPDKNPGDQLAEDAFKRCAEAYEVLSAPERRIEYDARLMLKGGAAEIVSGLFNDLTGGRFRRRVKGRTLRQTLELTLEQVARGGEHQLRFTVDELCPRCGGGGAAPGGKQSCNRCKGRGELPRDGLLSLPKGCPDCGGSGKRIRVPCQSCDGVGMREREREYRVTLPPGVETGTLKILRGEGEPGLYGGEAGDLRIIIEVPPHPLFTRDGAHAQIEVPITVDVAALGGSVEVPTFKGDVKMRIPAGTQSGRRFRIPGRGVAAGGDLIVRVLVEVPTVLDEAAKEAFHSLRQRLDESSYPRTAAYSELLAAREGSTLE